MHLQKTRVVSFASILNYLFALLCFNALSSFIQVINNIAKLRQSGGNCERLIFDADHGNGSGGPMMNMVQ